MRTGEGAQHPERPQQAQNGGSDLLANSLAWFSIGLGVAEVLAPKRIAHLIGMGGGRGTEALLRFYGFRELAAGIGILSRPREPKWLWGRTAGDVLDLATIGAAAASSDARPSRLAVAASAVLGVTALDVYCAQKLGGGILGSGPVHVKKTININRSPEEVYSYWHDFEHLPKFMDNLESVRYTGDGRTHWKARLPVGAPVEWDAETTSDQPNSAIAWRSLPGSNFKSSGSVRFQRATGGRGTLVTLELEYAFPGGGIGANIARLFGTEPGQQLERALRQLKQVLETGDIVRSDADIHRQVPMHPATPPEQAYGIRA